MPDKSPLPLTMPPQNAAEQEQDRSILRRMDSEDYATRREAIEECRRLPVRRIVRLMYALKITTQRKPVFGQRSAVIGIFSSITILGWFSALTGASVFILLAVLLFVLFCACAGYESVPIKAYSPRAADSLASVIEDIRDPDFLPIALRILHLQYMLAT